MALPVLTPIDIAALALIGVGLVVGAFRGLAGELAGLISAALAFTAGIILRVPLGLWLSSHSRLSHDSAYATAFCFCVIATWLLLLIPKLLIGKIMKVVVEKGFSVFGGMLAGALRMALWVIILFLAMQMIPHPYLNEKFGETSWVGRTIHRMAPELITTTATLDLPESIKTVTEDASEKLHDE